MSNKYFKLHEHFNLKWFSFQESGKSGLWRSAVMVKQYFPGLTRSNINDDRGVVLSEARIGNLDCALFTMKKVYTQIIVMGVVRQDWFWDDQRMQNLSGAAIYCHNFGRTLLQPFLPDTVEIDSPNSDKTVRATDSPTPIVQ